MSLWWVLAGTFNRRSDVSRMSVCRNIQQMVRCLYESIRTFNTWSDVYIMSVYSTNLQIARCLYERSVYSTNLQMPGVTVGSVYSTNLQMARCLCEVCLWQQATDGQVSQWCVCVTIQGYFHLFLFEPENFWEFHLYAVQRHW